MTEGNQSVPAVVGPSSALAERVSTAGGLFVGFDFDGTLTPIATDPDVPTISSRMARLLSRLADRETVRVAVISGRELFDLVDRVGVDDAVYAGNHGLELYRDGERSVRQGVEQYEERLQSTAETLQVEADRIPGCQVENKGLTLTVHVRNTPDDRLADARDVVSEAVSEESDLGVTTGKAVFEVKPLVSHDKGTAIAELAEETPADWLTLYLGDDTTDEDAFEAIHPEGIGIHVGTNEETAAPYRIRSQEEVPQFVEWLCEATNPERDS